MADPVVNASAKIWLGGYDLSVALNKIMLKGSRAELGRSSFGDDIVATHPGIQAVDLMLDGFWTAGVGEPDTVVAPRLVATSPDYSEWPLTILPDGAPSAGGADGNVAYNLRTAQFGMKFGEEHGNLLPFYLTSRARTGRLDRGTVMLPKASVSVTTTGVARQLGALTANDQIICILHVFSVTGGTWTLTVESDTVGFPSPITRATFTGATGITRQVIAVPGPITDDFWRCVLTKSGGTSAIAAAVLAIAPA